MDGSTIVDVRPPGGSFAGSEAVAINSAGHVLVVDLAGSGWFWDGSTHEPLPGVAVDLSASDFAAGVGPSGLFGWTPSGGFVDLSSHVPAGSRFQGPVCVNDAGHLAGLVFDGAGRGQFFDFDGTTTRFTTLGLPWLEFPSWTGDLDDADRLVAAAAHSGPGHAVLHDFATSSSSDLHPTSGPLAAWPASTALDINASGQIVGAVRGTGLPERAMLLEGGVAIDLQELMPSDVQESVATAINDAGVIVGNATTPTGTHAFRLVPVIDEAFVRIMPSTLNVRTLLGGLTAALTPSDSSRRIDPSSVELRALGGLPLAGGSVRPRSALGTADGGVHVRFDRRALEPALSALGPPFATGLEIELGGTYDDGAPFRAHDVVRVVGPGLPRPPRRH